MLANLILLAFVAAQAVCARFVMYLDEYHKTILPGPNITTGIDHVIISAAKSTLFTTDPAEPFEPFMSVANVTNLFDKGTKVLIAVGNWGDNAGFSLAATNETTRALFSKNVAATLDTLGADGVDIDWEYPGGNGDDYKKIPNSERVSEIETFPLLLAEIRAAIGPCKLLSIAVPGKEVDMIAYTPEQAPKIWESVDFVNLMTYDLMNRRNNMTTHHTGVQNSLETVDRYLALGLDPQKINLGFAYYAKWFTTSPIGDCGENPIGCPTDVLENPDGTDAGKSGAITFEKGNMAPAPENLEVSTDAQCGAAVGMRCEPGLCCSQYGSCGNTAEHCGLTCLPSYGDCPGPTISSSWLSALADSKTDTQGGGQYFWDADANIFWTWDTPELMREKFENIVGDKGLGGVMAWSLGEDSESWRHIGAMREGVKNSVAAPGCRKKKASGDRGL
ncbi:hypothetical protein FQN54_008249 [Arachnomyces sp. PD_36]|nr:hypothetical protein FQN54_008249 [Arachnomyces sp. PD_36]